MCAIICEYLNELKHNEQSSTVILNAGILHLDHQHININILVYLRIFAIEHIERKQEEQQAWMYLKCHGICGRR